MKKLAYISTSIFLILAIICLWPKESNLPEADQGKKAIQIVNQNPDRQISSSKAEEHHDNNENSQSIAKLIIQKNKEDNNETIQILIPKGKRLYDEEKMAEIATNANIEYLQSQLD